VADEARGVREAVIASLIDECRAVREEGRAQRSATEAEMTALRSDVGALRGDIVELTRMLRMQGDASDQVAEVMGRTLVRLSAEVEALAGALSRAGVAL
jgi:formylmethanofuran dehydrogenase subunit C